MGPDVIFQERQKFTQWWIWTIFIGVFVLYFYDVSRYLSSDPPQNLPTALLITGVLLFVVTYIFIICRLDTLIKTDGIYVRLYPFHIKPKFYSWSSLTKAYVRTYSPIVEYGGWGLRFSIFGKGKAYNIAGNQGLQLELTNRKRILIGTAKPEELTHALVKLGQLKQ